MVLWEFKFKYFDFQSILDDLQNERDFAAEVPRS